MIKGYTLPRTPKGISSLVPHPPWHYVGNIVAIEFVADPSLIEGYLPEPLKLESSKCCVYFVDWQYSSEKGQEFLNPAESQYKETIILMSASYKGKPLAYCPYIWVDHDKALLRGLIQGWPKQMGETHLTRSFELESKAAPRGLFGASLTVYGKRFIEGKVQIKESDAHMPTPTFAGSSLLRYFPDLQAGNHNKPLVNQLVQLKSRDVKISSISKGDAELSFIMSNSHELKDFSPLKVTTGYSFQVALTVDDLKILESL
ncbi:Acetoacetate decarboxylase (ADC) [Dethiosulfatibacter aminovorans DSM 17477]|uniref:Acetoacetate decarboxylase (ADC) n=1 Tax=Dethiosulfatibacter aminovorans DSM 17477 TaxID=1121476 RepID=A0A1M6MGZ4_9FIRM|nr:acetoacetate decarboxylase family protein [Dethiosulfatibacter aminovorans]SHJ82744.1 Acetoacetate decarboxylase (ADC) [Dethiosulfatibacter aminovorans DSM 17477]